MPILTGSLWPSNDGRSRAHIPATPRWTGIVRLVQLALAVTLVPLTASTVAEGHRIKWSGIDGYRLSWVASSWTIIYVVSLVGILLFAPRLYSLWAHLAFECVTAVIWLLTLAFVSSHSWDLAAVVNNAEVYRQSPRFRQSYLRLVELLHETFATAALAGVSWLLFIVTLALTAWYMRKHLVAGRPVTANSRRRRNGQGNATELSATGTTSRDHLSRAESGRSAMTHEDSTLPFATPVPAAQEPPRASRRREESDGEHAVPPSRQPPKEMVFAEKPSRSSSTSTSQSPPPSFDAALYKPLASNPVEFLTSEKEDAPEQGRNAATPAADGRTSCTTRNKC